MTKVVFDMSISLDGFTVADGSTPENPLGPGGSQLHEWYFQGDQQTLNKIPDPLKDVGALICGKVTYETSGWSGNGPHAPRPVFVLTHKIPKEPPVGNAYHFVSDIKAAVEKAKQAANGLNVRIMGGAGIGQQALRAGLVDEVVVHIVPVLFGKGKPLFGDWDDAHHALKILEVVDTPLATHVRYEVVK